MHKFGRKHLLLNTTILRGRRLKDETEDGGPAAPPAAPVTPPPVENNAEGNTNNTGDDFDAGSFWGPEAPEEVDPNESKPEDIRQQIKDRLQNLSFGNPAFDAQTMEQLGEGNFEGINERFQALGQQAVQQSLGLMVGLLKPFAEQLQKQMREEFGGTLTSRDNDEQLIRDFPSAKDPKIRPVVQNLYAQALSNTKGNREQAVAQVKSMMSLINQSTADDLGLDVAPRGASDFGRSRNPTINWIDELSAKQ